MTMMIGVVLSKNINRLTLNRIRKDTGLALLEVQNEYINRQLESDESFFQATSYGIDSSSGIGAYEFYTKDLTPILEIPEKETRDTMMESVLELRRDYYSDAIKWLEVIKKIKNKYKVPKMGIIYFNGYTTINEIKLDIIERIKMDIEILSVEKLMKIEKNALVFFE